MKTFLKVTALVALLAVAGCAKDRSRAGDESSGSSGGYGSSTESGSAGESIVGTPQASGSEAAAKAAGTVLHFDFDKSEILAADMPIVEAWGKYLAANPGAKVRLEGHTDERGTREYNIALGERRGNSVLQALTSRGVSERQLTVASFGEERPVAMGHDESAWAQNRRVEIVK